MPQQAGMAQPDLTGLDAEISHWSLTQHNPKL